MAAERQVRFDPLLDCGQAELVEAGDVGVVPGVDRSAPEADRIVERRCCRRCVPRGKPAPPLRDQALEAQRVELVRLDRDPVAALLPADPRRPVRNRLPQLRYIDLQRLPRALRRPLTPDGIDETVDRHVPVRREQQPSQERPLLRAAERAPALHLEWPQDSEERPHTGLACGGFLSVRRAFHLLGACRAGAAALPSAP